MGEIKGEGGWSLSGAAVTVRAVNGSGSTARGLWCVTKATRRVGVFEEKWMRSNIGMNVVEEDGGEIEREAV